MIYKWPFLSPEYNEYDILCLVASEKNQLILYDDVLLDFTIDAISTTCETTYTTCML